MLACLPCSTASRALDLHAEHTANPSPNSATLTRTATQVDSCNPVLDLFDHAEDDDEAKGRPPPRVDEEGTLSAELQAELRAGDPENEVRHLLEGLGFVLLLHARMHMHAGIHAYTHAMPACMHACMRTCAHAYMRTGRRLA